MSLHSIALGLACGTVGVLCYLVTLHLLMDRQER